MTSKPSAPTPVHTIGHGGRTVPEILELLRGQGVRFLLDVRTQPYSRYQPEFSREPLQGALQGAGLRYVFLGEQLGGRPRDPACYQEGQVDYRLLRQTPEFQQGMKRLRQAAAQGHRVALLCSEARPELCHRTKLIGRALQEEGIPVLHIDERGLLREQQEVEMRLTGGQVSLFPEVDAVDFSRKGVPGPPASPAALAPTRRAPTS